MSVLHIFVIEGNIVEQHVDAIVNAANQSLLGGGGVDGAIHRAAGQELVAECMTLGGCMTGDAKLTRAYRLPAKWVVHAVGPIWKGGGNEEDSLLCSTYKRSLEIASAAGAKTIAIPAISTGAYAFPLQRASVLAVSSVAEFQLLGHNPFDEIRLVCFNRNSAMLHEQALAGYYKKYSKNFNHIRERERPAFQ